MAEGGMSSEAPKKRVVGRLITTLVSLFGLVGCKAASEAEMRAMVEATLAAQNRTPEVVSDEKTYGEAKINGNAAAAYIQSCRDYVGEVKNNPEAVVKKNCDTLIHENNEGSSLPTNHTVWVTPRGVEIFDSAPALYNRVQDNDPSTSFSQELNNTFGDNGTVIFAMSFPEMDNILSGLAGLNPPTRLTRWDNSGGVSKITTFEGPEAYRNAGITN